MFPPATPESKGLPSAAILALIDRLEREGHDPHGSSSSGKGAFWRRPFGRPTGAIASIGSTP